MRRATHRRGFCAVCGRLESWRILTAVAGAKLLAVLAIFYDEQNGPDGFRPIARCAGLQRAADARLASPKDIFTKINP
jgi:hypothetical protein